MEGDGRGEEEEEEENFGTANSKDNNMVLGRKRKATCSRCEEGNGEVAAGVGSAIGDAAATSAVFLDIDDEGIEVDELMLAEVMRKLEDVINNNRNNPSSSSSIRPTESCGSSFSDSSSTVMASIDTRGVSFQPLAFPTSAASTGSAGDEDDDDEFFHGYDKWVSEILGMDGMQYDGE